MGLATKPQSAVPARFRCREEFGVARWVGAPRQPGSACVQVRFFLGGGLGLRLPGSERVNPSPEPSPSPPPSTSLRLDLVAGWESLPLCSGSGFVLRGGLGFEAAR